VGIMKTLNEIQKIAKNWVNEKGFKWSAYASYCHLVEEVGELGEALTVKEGERNAGTGEKGDADHSDMEEELADVMFSVFDLANRFNIDMEKSFDKAIIRYDKKVERRQ